MKGARWSGGRAQLWFLGDLVDRGPDGIGVIELVMSLAEQARAAGGYVDTLLGNHEVLLLGMHRFGGAEVQSGIGLRSFARSWGQNGGQASDQDALTADHVAWLIDRPVLALIQGHLLMHSDTTEYLDWGSAVEEVNATVRRTLHSDDIAGWWDVWRRMTYRHAFRGPAGEQEVDRVLGALGGQRLVHGHSLIAEQLGIMPAEIDRPHCYAGGKALGVDGGLFIGGPCLVVPLPSNTP